MCSNSAFDELGNGIVVDHQYNLALIGAANKTGERLLDIATGMLASNTLDRIRDPR